jgi:hypothetical protein
VFTNKSYPEGPAQTSLLCIPSCLKLCLAPVPFWEWDIEAGLVKQSVADTRLSSAPNRRTLSLAAHLSPGCFCNGVWSDLGIGLETCKLIQSRSQYDTGQDSPIQCLLSHKGSPICQGLFLSTSTKSNRSLGRGWITTWPEALHTSFFPSFLLSAMLTTNYGGWERENKISNESRTGWKVAWDRMEFTWRSQGRTF